MKYLLFLSVLTSLSTFAMESNFKYSLNHGKTLSVKESQELLSDALLCFKHELDVAGELDLCLTSEEIVNFRQVFLKESANAILVKPEEGLVDEDIRINSFEEINCVKSVTIECRIIMDVDATFGVQSKG